MQLAQDHWPKPKFTPIFKNAYDNLVRFYEKIL